MQPYPTFHTGFHHLVGGSSGLKGASSSIDSSQGSYTLLSTLVSTTWLAHHQASREWEVQWTLHRAAIPYFPHWFPSSTWRTIRPQGRWEVQWTLHRAAVCCVSWQAPSSTQPHL